MPKQNLSCAKKGTKVPLRNPTFSDTLAPYSTHTASHSHTFEEFSQWPGLGWSGQRSAESCKKQNFKSKCGCMQKRSERKDWERGISIVDKSWHDPNAFPFVDASSLLIAHSFSCTHARKALATDSRTLHVHYTNVNVYMYVASWSQKKHVYDTLRLTRSYMLCAVEASIENI